MGIYYDSTTDEEDIIYIKTLIANNEVYVKDNKIYWKCYDSDELIWEQCELNSPETFPGEPNPIQTPWGIGRWTCSGYSCLMVGLMKAGKSSNTL